MYGYCLDDPVNMVDPLGLKGRWKIDNSYVKERAKGLGHGFIDILSIWSKAMSYIPDFRQEGAEALAEAIKGYQKDDQEEPIKVPQENGQENTGMLTLSPE